MMIHQRNQALGAGVLFLTTVLGGCSASSSQSSQPPPTNNLTIQELQIATAEPRVGYALEVLTKIDVEEMTEDVSVSYFALNKDDLDLGLDEIRQFFLATVNFPTIDPWSPDHLAEFTIPPGVNPPGDYVIRAVLDPAELLAETDESDNFSDVNATFAPLAAPNIFIESMELDSSVILLDPSFDDVAGDDIEDLQNSDEGATLVIGVPHPWAPHPRGPW